MSIKEIYKYYIFVLYIMTSLAEISFVHTIALCIFELGTYAYTNAYELTAKRFISFILYTYITFAYVI